jgi:pimeloyl-[acyl-carrier protein] methyl ester esterase
MPPDNRAAHPPELLLLHGWGMHGGLWRELAGALDGRFRVTCPDLPGHGGSPARPPRLADWTAALLEAAPPRAVWLGWSLGGSLALEAALTAPRRIRGLCLVGATPRFLRAPDWPHGLAPETLARFHAQLGSDPRATLARFLALQVQGGDASRELLRTLRQRLAERPAPDPQVLEHGLELLRDTDHRARLTGLRVPSLWLFGERDTLVPRSCADRLARQLPDARTEVIPGAAHAPFLSHPDLFLARLAGFLEHLEQLENPYPPESLA